ncbi:flagellar hook protein FlgE [bacterium]|nr:flagellar hook protein FlgE [bacterium]
MSSTAMNSAITGLSNFQKMLDVVSNNIANVNTAGYKHSKVNFQELYAQTFRPAAAPSSPSGGSNAVQVGLGSSLASIDSVMTQGILEITDNPTDLAISGDGYFVLGANGNDVYTRNGHFLIDAGGSVVDGVGRPLQGWAASSTGVIDQATKPAGIRVPFGDSMTAQPTANMKMVGNLDGSQAIFAAGPPATGGRFVTEATVYDSLGQDYRVQVTFTKVAAPVGAAAAWNWSADLGAANLGTGVTAFDPNGRYLAASSTANPSFTLTPTNGAAPVVVAPDFATVTQLVTPGRSTVAAGSQDGYPAGTLANFSIDRNGLVVGRYTNGMSKNLAQVALAYFTNPQGLERASGGLLMESGNSGKPQLGAPGSDALGELTAGALEASNVDLSKEFTRLIQAQRAFQANSRVITTMDEVMGEVSNLRR